MERLWTVAKHKRHGNNVNIDACRQWQNTLMIHKVAKKHSLACSEIQNGGGHLPRGCILVCHISLPEIGAPRPIGRNGDLSLSYDFEKIPKILKKSPSSQIRQLAKFEINASHSDLWWPQDRFREFCRMIHVITTCKPIWLPQYNNVNKSSLASRYICRC